MKIKNILNNNKKILFLIVFFTFLILLKTPETFSIYKQTLQDEIYLTVTSSDGIVITFNSMGGSSVDSVPKEYGERLGTLEAPTKEGMIFDGWYTSDEGGTKVTGNTIVTGSTTYFAHWNPIICIPAEEGTLHKESTVTYGTIPSSPNLVTGDAYDCKVTTTGDYTERFYYLTDDEYGNALFIYSNNTHLGEANCGADGVLYNDERLSYLGPTTAYLELPSTTQWNNLQLHNLPRQIVNENGEAIVNPTTSTTENIPTFNYTDRAARFVTTQELERACNIEVTTATASNGQLSSCMFLVENTSYKVSSCRSNWWAETPMSTGNSAYRVAKTIKVESISFAEAGKGFSAVRPLIEVPKGSVLRVGNPREYEIQFDSQGGTPIDTVNMFAGQMYGQLESPTKEGMIFDGWYTAPTGGTKITSASIVTGDIVLYAQWEGGSGFLISFDTQGGEPVDSILVAEGSTVGELEVPIRSGYAFAGWYTTADGNTRVTSETEPTESTTYFAHWILASSSTAAIGDINYDTLQHAINDVPTDNNEVVVKLLKTVSECVTVSSGQNIKFNLQEYTLSGSGNHVITNNGTITIYNGTLSDSSKDGIYNNGTVTVSGGTITVAGDQAAINNNSGARLYVTGGSISNTNSTKGQAIYNDGGRVEISGNPTITNKNAPTSDKVRAAVHNTKTTNSTMLITGGTIISENYVGVKNDNTTAYSLVIGTLDNAYDATSPVIQGNTYGVETVSNIKLLDGILKGITAAINNESKIPEAGIEVDSEKQNGTEIIGANTYNTLYYTLSSTDVYEITFNHNDGIITTTNVEINQGSSLGDNIPTNVTKTNHIFDGWYTLLIGGEEVDENTVPTGNITYFAHWTPNINNATISPSEIELTLGETENISVTGPSDMEGVILSSNDPNVVTVTNNGLVTAVGVGTATITVRGNRSNVERTINVTVNALPTYTITFNSMGGSAVAAKENIESGSQIGVLATPTKTGKVFAGWYTSDEGGTRITEETLVTSSTTYYAHWDDFVCRRATTLHTSTCNINNTYAGCGAAVGYENDITFGSLVNGTPVAGNAYDCKVSTTGDYTERFYLVTTNGNNSVLIYDRNMNGEAQYAYASNQENWHGPITAYQYLPSTSLWDNLPESTLPGTRQIVDENGNATTNLGNNDIEEFTYTGKAARFLTFEEVQASCGYSGMYSNGYFDNCNWLMDNVPMYVNGTSPYGYWLETPSSENGKSVYGVGTFGRYLLAYYSSDAYSYGVRPAIEIPSSYLDNTYVAPKYTITFNYNDGIITTTNVEINQGSSLGDNIPTNITKTNNIFDGWYTLLIGGEEIDENTVPTGNITYFAHWTPDINNATISPSSLDLTYGSVGNISISGPSDMESYTITSGNIDVVTVTSGGLVTTTGTGTTTITVRGSRSNIERVINVEVTVPQSYTITLNLMGGECSTTELNVNHGSNVGEIPTPTKDGHVFEGWYTDETEGTLVTSETVPTGNDTYYARWKAYLCKRATVQHTKECTRTSDGCFASGYVSNNKGTTITYGIIPNSATYASGFAYDCDVNKDGTYDSTTERFYYMRTLDGKAVLISSSNFEGTNGQPDGTQTVNTFNYATALTKLPTTTQWSNVETTFDDNRAARFASMEDLSVACNTNSLTTTGALDSCEYVLENSQFESTSETNGRTATWLLYDGSKYTRIFTKSRATAEVESSSNNVARPVIEVPLKYMEPYDSQKKIIEFDSQGGTEVADIERYVGQLLGTLEEPTKTGFIFDGWYTLADGGTRVNSTTVVIGSTKYYAHWTQNGYKIEFDSQGGTEVDDKIISEGHTLGNLKPYPTKENSFFAGWYTAASGGTVVTSETEPTGNTKYYAHWLTSPTAEIDGIYYDTLPNAILAVPANDVETTITVLKNVSGLQSVKAHQNIVLNLQNYTLSNGSSNVIDNNGTIKMSTGKISCTAGSGAINNNSGATFILSGGSVEATGTRQGFFNDGGTLIISGNATVSSTTNQRATVQNKNNGTVKITGGTITSSNLYAVYNESGSIEIGTKDNEHDVTTPVIQGKTYGVVANSTYKFYDGIIKGQTAPVGTATTGNTPTVATDTNRTKISEVEQGAQPQTDTEGSYKTLYYILGQTQYLITFNANGGTTTAEPRYIDIGERVGTLPTAERGVYTFAGWFTDPDEGTEITANTIPTGNTTYFAHWTYTPNQNIIDFNPTSDVMTEYYANISTWKNDQSTFQDNMLDNFYEYSCKCAASSDTGNTCEASLGGNVSCDKPNGYNTGLNAPVNVFLSDENKTKGAQVSYTHSSTGVIYNLIPGQVYKWELASDPTIYGYVRSTAKRRILDTGALGNTRDLGGMPVDVDGNGTIDGTLKYEKLMRGQKVETAANVTELTNLGMTEQIDLRKSSEVGNSEVFLSKYSLQTFQHYQNDIEHYPTYYAQDRAVIKKIMQDIVAGESIYFHCRIGADRTGTVAYILEGLLGVTDEEKLQDYELTVFAGQTNRHRYYATDPTSSVSKTEKFRYMYDFMENNSEIYEWYMKAITTDNTKTDEEKAELIEQENDLITAFRNAMIDYPNIDPTVTLTEKTGMTYNGDEQAANTATVTLLGNDTFSGTINYNYYVDGSCTIPYTAPICRKATSLHEKECKNYGLGCGLDVGYDKTITYGSLWDGTSELQPGDALECDVTGTGNYERFYYITSNGTGNNETAVLIYDSNVQDGTTRVGTVVGSEGYIAYDSSNKSEYGPRTGYQYLPSTTQWSNNQIIAPGTRQIKTDEDTTTISYSGTNYQMHTFTYTDKAARFLTYQEVVEICGSGNTNSGGYLDNCNYLLENIGSYETSSTAIIAQGYWLESPRGDYYSSVHYTAGSNKFITSSSPSNDFGVRPVIEVLKSNIVEKSTYIPSEVGLYYVKASTTAFGNYNAAESSCVAHTIAKSDTTTTLSNIEKAYDGTSQHESGANSILNSNNETITDGTYTYTYYNGTSCEISNIIPFAPTNIGEYSFKATLTSSDTYNSSTSNCATLTIVPNTVTITINKGGTAWNNSGINVALYQNDTLIKAYSSATVNDSTVTFSTVPAGTYDIYISQDDSHLTTLEDSSINVEVNGNATAVIDFYQITIDANGGKYQDNSTSKTIIYKPKFDLVTKVSHTQNIDDTGLKMFNYDNNWNESNITGTDRGDTSLAHVVTIPEADSINVDIYYNGENIKYDWATIWEGAHPDYSAENDYELGLENGKELGGSQSDSYTVNGNSLTDMGYSTFTISGDSVTFGFISDNSQSGKGYGYYAVVTGYGKTIVPFTGTYEEPTRADYIFEKWNTMNNGEGVDYGESEFINTTYNTTLYAKYRTSSATFKAGTDFNIALKQMSGQTSATSTTTNSSITAITRYTQTPSETTLASATIVSSDESESNIYAWYSNGTIYWYTVSEDIYFNSNCNYMFNRFSKLDTLDLSEFDLSNVTTATYMLNGLTDLKTIVTPKVNPSLSISIGKTMVKPNNAEVNSISSSIDPMTVLKVPYTIVFEPNGGEFTSTCSDTRKIYPGNPVGSLPTNPSRSGYSFDNWYTSKNGGSQITSSTVPQESTTYYAHWNKTGVWAENIEYDNSNTGIDCESVQCVLEYLDKYKEKRVNVNGN